jgi:hypothetical protein
MADISPTLDLIDSAIGQGSSPASGMTPGGVPIGENGLPRVTISPANQAIDVLQAGIDGKLPAATKPYETTGKSLALNTEAGANNALASTLGAPVDIVNAGLRKIGLPVSEKPFGGSESIKSAMGLIHANPDAVVPQNEAERIAHGIGEGAGSAVLLPLGGEALAAGKVISPQAAQVVRSAVGAPDALNATIGGAAGAGSTVAADAVPEPYKPLAATVGGLVGGLPVVAAHTAATGAKAALEAFRNHVTEDGAKRTVGKEMAAAATDQAAARENLANNPHEIVPGSVGTTGQIAGDTGLLNWERGIRQQNPAEFNNREAAQNSAQIAHLESVQPTGNAADLPGVIQSQRDAAARAAGSNTGVVDALSNASVKSAEAGQKSALEGLKTLAPEASPAEVSAHFRNVRDALEADHETAMAATAHKAEQARLASAPTAQTPEQVGQNLRAPAEEARSAAKEASDKLYAALPKDIKAPTAEIAAKAKEIKGGMLPEHAPMAGEEARLFDLAADYGDNAPLANLNALRSSILTEKANVKRTNPQAFGRLAQLQGAVENAIDHGIESRAALDQVAVRRGTMTAEDALPARINQTFDESVRQPAAVEVHSGRDGSDTGRSTGGNAASAGIEGQANVGSGNAASGEGLSQASRGNPTEANRAGQQDRMKFDFSPATPENSGVRESKVGDTTIKYVVMKDGNLELTLIKTPENARGNGSARAALEQFAKEADQSGKRIELTADPMDKATKKSGLVDFYKSAGFVRNAGKNKDFTTRAEFLREPQPIKENPPPFAETNSAVAGAEPVGGNSPLREANAAYKDLKQTFDEGPVGEITSKNGRGQYDLSPAELTKQVFHPGDTGGEDVRAYVKAVGPEKANTALSDAAAASLHEKATRPDGTLDPKKVDSWLAAHKTAIAELPPEARTKFENAANAQRAVEDAFAARRDALNAYDKSEAGKLMGLKDTGDIVREVGGVISSKDGAKRMGELAQAAKDNPAAKEGLQRAVVEHVMNKFLPENLDKAQAFIKDKADVLGKVFTPEEIDGISKKIEAAQTAGSKLESAKANRETAMKEAQASEKETLSRYDQTILGKIMKTEGTANVLDKLGTVFGSSDSAKQMGLLAEEAAKVKGGTDALRKAVTEMIRRDYSGTAEVGTSGEKGLSRAALDKFMKENTETLEKVLSPEQVGKLKAIVDDQLRANRSITATKLKGGSDTAQNLNATKGGSILSLLAKQATEVGGTVIGSILGGPGGAVVGNIGAKASAALRDAGLNRLSEIRIRAALDPQFGKALLDEVPKYPDRNAAALIALRARQLSVAGAMAGARQH